MKIDIHVHTKKIKSGDPIQRNIDADKFNNIIRATDVKILAITNHNHFDITQYNEFRSIVQGECQIWPGIELDILEEGRHAHLIAIVNPINAAKFNECVQELLKSKTAETFTISISDTVKSFDNLDAIYVAHYHSKKPNLIDKDVDTLMSCVSNKKRVLKEATNSISAGIYISHGHNSIYGSDIQNWDDYEVLSKDLPGLRLPVESYEQFCLLLEKDQATIDTILNKKTKESIQLSPFGIAELINVDVYNDINIIFGSKGTGKTEILKALSKYYNDKGYRTEVYESNSKRLEDTYDTRGSLYSVNIASLGIDDCSDEISFLRSATEKNVTSLSAYRRYFSAEQSNKISKRIKITQLQLQDEDSPKREFENILRTVQELHTFETYISSDEILQKIVGEELFKELESVIGRVMSKIDDASDLSLTEYKTICLLNQFIKVFTSEIARKTGTPEKPIKTGFHEYASNRIKIETYTRKIIENIGRKIEPQMENVGNLGEKGELFCQTTLVIQNGGFTDGSYTTIKKVNKSPQKNVALKLIAISKYVYSNSLFEKISDLNAVEDSQTISCLSDMLLFKRNFVLDGSTYTPSNGESSMVLLHNELKKDKEIYIIDEPEKSLGNDYISDVIVPLLNDRARTGRKIIIATHDANIAVRTLPYNSIYRKHGATGYFTYCGNPYSNKLTCVSGNSPDMDWKEVSMKTLEGGKEAFGERGKIYGNT